MQVKIHTKKCAISLNANLKTIKIHKTQINLTAAHWSVPSPCVPLQPSHRTATSLECHSVPDEAMSMHGRALSHYESLQISP